MTEILLHKWMVNENYCLHSSCSHESHNQREGERRYFHETFKVSKWHFQIFEKSFFNLVQPKSSDLALKIHWIYSSFHSKT